MKICLEVNFVQSVVKTIDGLWMYLSKKRTILENSKKNGLI